MLRMLSKYLTEMVIRLITADELRLTINNLGEPLTEAEVKAMLAEADLEDDVLIKLVRAECVRCWHKRRWPL